MNTWKVILATLVIFATGVVTGGLLAVYSGRSFVLRPQHPNAPRSPQSVSAGGLRLEFLRRIQRDLDLTPEQRERIDKILKESQEHTRKLMEPISPALKEEFQRTKEEFRQVLTAEQRARFDELFKHQQRPHEQQRHPVAPAQRPSDAATATNAP
ncbi:MAG TPA: hypothetical protein VNZ64_28210 [Candidatus Acidoferrum sp.]|nr:hypothetical protein [Candidatus Acidoferrum sp.]